MKSIKVNLVLAHILLFLVNLIYGANFSIAKKIMPLYIQPFGFIFYRVMISLILYGIIYFLFFREKIDRKDWGRFIACGFFGIAINQLLFFKGISMTSSIHGSLLMITAPINTYVFSHLLIKEKMVWYKILGIILGALGASILIFSSFTEVGNASIAGDLCVAVNAISFSIYLILVKPLMHKYNPLTVIFLCFLTGSFWVGIFGYQDAMAFNWSSFPKEYYGHFIFVILAATFLVYLFNIIAIQSVSPTTVSSYIYLQPFFAILISLIYTDEKLSLYTCIGGICIIFGLWLINKQFESKNKIT